MMEDYLHKFRLLGPPEGFRERALRPPERIADSSWADRLWSSRLFWLSAAAILLACVTLGQLNVRAEAPREVSVPYSVELAELLADALGDGPCLKARLKRQLAWEQLGSTVGPPASSATLSTPQIREAN